MRKLRPHSEPNSVSSQWRCFPTGLAYRAHSLNGGLFLKQTNKPLLSLPLDFHFNTPTRSALRGRNLHFCKVEKKFCFSSPSPSLCPIAKATDRDRCTQVAEGSAQHIKQAGKGLCGAEDWAALGGLFLLLMGLGRGTQQPVPSSNSLGPWSVPVKFPSSVR